MKTQKEIKQMRKEINETIKHLERRTTKKVKPKPTTFEILSNFFRLPPLYKQLELIDIILEKPKKK